jgi:hypothetical protein
MPMGERVAGGLEKALHHATIRTESVKGRRMGTWRVGEKGGPAQVGEEGWDPESLSCWGCPAADAGVAVTNLSISCFS